MKTKNLWTSLFIPPALFLIFLLSGTAAAGENHPFIIQRFDQLENLEIVYDYPNFSNPVVRLYASSSCDSLVKTFDIAGTVRFSVINPSPGPKEFDDTVMKQDYYSKKIFESITHKRTIVSLAMLHESNEFIYGNFKNDLLLWKEVPEGFQLVRIYPEAIGGCLFCGSQFSHYGGDTLGVEFSGKGGGEEWGGREFFVVKGDSIVFLESERFRAFSPYNGKGNPIAEARSHVIEKYQYDKNGKLADTHINFNARYADGSPVKLLTRSDSLQLFKADVDFLNKPLQPVKFIRSKDIPVQVGPVQGGLIAVYWENKWYLSRRGDFNYRPPLLNN